MSKKVSSIKQKDQGEVEILDNGLKKYSLDVIKHKTFPYVEPGVYKISAEMTETSIIYYLNEMELVSDKIIDLPSEEYTFVTKQITEFLRPETKQKYKDLDYVYKRSILLYGLPGTGKTCLVNRIAADIVKANGIVIFSDYPSALKMLDTMFCVQNKTSLAAVILEEFDKYMHGNGADLLTLLDGQIQRDNTMYLCTTNYIEKIPARILRPGRINVKCEVKYPNIEARRYYLSQKVKDVAIVESIAQATEDLSIDELKEIVQAVLILNEDLNTVVANMRKLNVQIKEEEEKQKNAPMSTINAFRSFLL